MDGRTVIQENVRLAEAPSFGHQLVSTKLLLQVSESTS